MVSIFLQNVLSESTKKKKEHKDAHKMKLIFRLDAATDSLWTQKMYGTWGIQRYLQKKTPFEINY